ncbi:TPA: hypothetical protein K7634_004434 [Salmonella enterica]|nr:hypothetical protein [Salmonella enterica]HBI5318496.1 hypothetical protein [Salmonella enterica]
MKKKAKNKKQNRRKNKNTNIKKDELYYPYQYVSLIVSIILSTASVYLFITIEEPKFLVNDLNYYMETTNFRHYCIEYTAIEKSIQFIVGGAGALFLLGTVILPDVIINRPRPIKRL